MKWYSFIILRQASEAEKASFRTLENLIRKNYKRLYARLHYNIANEPIYSTWFTSNIQIYTYR